MSTSMMEFIRAIPDYLEGDEQAIYIASPTNLKEFGITLTAVQMVVDETAHAFRVVFHNIAGWLVITIAGACDERHAEEMLRMVLLNIGVTFTRVLV